LGPPGSKAVPPFIFVKTTSLGGSKVRVPRSVTRHEPDVTVFNDGSESMVSN